MWSHFSDGLLFRYILNGHWLALGWFVERFKSKQTHTDCKRTIAALWLVGWDNNDYGWVLKGQWGLAAVAAEISSVFVEVSHMAKIARDFHLEVKSDYCKNNGKSKFAVGHKRQIVASPMQNEKRAGYLLMALSVNFLFGMALFVPPTAQTPFIIRPTTTNHQLILAAIQDSHKTRERNTYTKKDLFPRISFPFIHWICCDYAFKKKRKIESSATVQIPSWNGNGRHSIENEDEKTDYRISAGYT